MSCASSDATSRCAPIIPFDPPPGGRISDARNPVVSSQKVWKSAESPLSTRGMQREKALKSPPKGRSLSSDLLLTPLPHHRSRGGLQSENSPPTKRSLQLFTPLYFGVEVELTYLHQSKRKCYALPCLAICTEALSLLLPHRQRHHICSISLPT